MKVKSKIKRALFIVMGAAMLLAGCGDDSSGKSESQLYEEEFATDKFDSYIVYKVGDELDDSRYNDLSRALENRLDNACSDKKQDHFSQSRQTQTNTAEKTVTIYFNNTKKVTQDYLQATASPNLVEIRKGDKPDGEVVVTNEHILDAYAQPDGGNWVVMLEFTPQGREIFKKTAQELGGSTVPVTVWIDGKAQDVKLMTEPKMYGNAIVTGSFDEQAAKKLALQLRSGYLNNKLTVDVCVLNKNRA